MPEFRIGADGFGVRASSSTGGRRMRERREEDEEEEEAGSHLLQHATTFQSSLRCLLCDRRAGSETECDLFVFVWGDVYARLSFQYASDKDPCLIYVRVAASLSV